MRALICFFLMMAALGAAEKAAARKASPQPEKAKQAAAPARVTIPPGATETEPGTYTYTDAAGKKWIYRETPFGVAKLEDKGEAADTGYRETPFGTVKTTAPAVRNDPEADRREINSTTAIDDGEYVRFERPGPFGVYRWKRKKTDLSGVEKAVWERQSEKEGQKGETR